MSNSGVSLSWPAAAALAAAFFEADPAFADAEAIAAPPTAAERTGFVAALWACPMALVLRPNALSTDARKSVNMRKGWPEEYSA